MRLDWLLQQFFNAYWPNLVKDPWFFIVGLIIGFVLGWTISAKLQDIQTKNQNSTIDSLKSRIDLLKGELDAKNLTPSKVTQNSTALSKLPNLLLKEKAFATVKTIRRFVQEKKSEEDNLFSTPDGKPSKTRDIGEYLNQTRQTSSEYNTLFKTDTILLREELLTRLPAFYSTVKLSNYENPSGFAGMNNIADDLEKMADSLLN